MSDHFNGYRFFNPGGPRQPKLSLIPRLLRAPRPPWPFQVAVEPRRPPLREGPDEVVVTFIGHSTFLLQTPEGNILTDPIYSQRASPVPFLGPRRVRQPGVNFADLPEISFVLISHNHYDHCDLPTLKRLARPIVTPLGNAAFFRRAGLPRVEELDWWQTARTTPFPVTLTPARHFAARTPFDRNCTLWGGFVIEVAGRVLYFAGDTAYGPHFRQIRQRFGPVDLALLPIGAYAPQFFFGDVHVDPAQAVQAHLDLESRRSVPMHYGTFRLTFEGLEEPLQELDRARQALEVSEREFGALECGESLRL